MNKLGSILNNSGVALYLFANGILGFNEGNRWKGEFRDMLTDIIGAGTLTDVLVVFLSVSAITAGIFLLLSLFRMNVPLTDWILLVFFCMWVIFIIVVDIVLPIKNYRNFNFLRYILQIAAHLMALGGIASATKRFARRKAALVHTPAVRTKPPHRSQH